ncbi:MAG: SMI1/KNR4 family protein [Hyalangium sp.]|uniref:SMI1/KNR4 family protein n=1 Tax=Hyalangium sp. TaxID=2028555 RepID=UPI00389A466B
MRELMEYIRQYDPAFSSRVEGASQEEVARLEQLVGQPLPARYKQFLRTLGRSMGDLQAEDTDFRIERVLKFYENSKRRPPARYILIGAQVADTYDQYLLDRAAASGEEDCAVVQADPAEPFTSTDYIHTLYPSLQDMLFVLAFSTKRMAMLPHRRDFLPSLVDSGKGRLRIVPSGLLDSLEGILGRLGFQKLPYTSALNPLFERGDAALYASRSPEGDGVTIELGAEDQREFRRLSEILRDNTPLV